MYLKLRFMSPWSLIAQFGPILASLAEFDPIEASH